MEKLRVVRDFKAAGRLIKKGDLIIITDNEMIVLRTHAVQKTPVGAVIDIKESYELRSVVARWIEAVHDNTKEDDLV